VRLLHLYRPRLPGLRAQAIQVVHTCHALAELGFETTLLADRAGDGEVGTALSTLGLQPHPCLDLHLCPTAHPPSAGLWFRARLAQWWSGPPGVVLARDKRRLVSSVRLLPRRHRIVLETHELDSALASERGDDPAHLLQLERRALSSSDALVANCGGTLAAWAEAHGDRIPKTSAVIHNGTAPDRATAHRPPQRPVLRYLGSLRAMKGLLGLLEQAGPLPMPLQIIGASPEEIARAPAHLEARPPVPYTQVPELLSTATALLLPLQSNLFGEQLSSPLKLWDYLGSGAPIVAADVRSVREILQLSHTEAHLYDPTQPASLLSAITEAAAAPPRLPYLRSWAARAAELAPILRGQP
jgi:hypothetical protein